MAVKNIVKKNRYLDSVLLMLISNQIKELDGIVKASVMMGTDNNRALLEGDGLLLSEGKEAGANDLLIALLVKDNADLEVILEEIEKLLSQKKKVSEEKGSLIPKSMESALSIMSEANMVVISLPGDYARWEAEKALMKGLHVMLFSDNVSVEDEIELKTLAREKGLLLMGPDCGTSIINNVALGFANIVNKGNIGIVGASGTGIQEVTSLITNAGCGITQAIGTGGRDLSARVGGLTMTGALEALIEDKKTEIILLISKPPSPQVEDKILDILEGCPKPFIINFLGGDVEKSKRRGYKVAKTLEEAAYMAVAFVKKEDYKKIEFNYPLHEIKSLVEKEWSKFSKDQKYIRGLYSGGSVCEEANIVLDDLGILINSNAPIREELKLKNSKKSVEHSFVDMGDDEFTRGVPHPMIDFTLRKERIIEEAKDPECAVILMDVVLGLGVHENPAEEIASAVVKAKKIAEEEGRYLSVVVSITGTSKDPQNRDRQKKILHEAGVIVMPTNAQAARFSALVVRRES
ncbi:MAG TPA: acyl-CoA synthetase FdrA [Candidatus Eremiobacteraeota bacterium]|mgnify:CR=1 FL=1|nr:MAG: Succinyl-CoA ligase (ADP-forming) subunit alpha [bacterium ADurb.Bin363]HPZ07937.1 acyl-CoA synthetase FdrA [Candidatus Eremiobacteraeota bacterium]